MAKLEDKVLETICKAQADDAVQMMHDPSHQNFLKEIYRDMIKNLLSTLPPEFTEEEKTQIVVNLSPETLLANQLKDEAKLREEALRDARNQYLRSRSDLEQVLHLQPQIKKMKKKSPEMAADLDALVEKLFAGLASMMQFNTGFIADLTAIAKKSGIEQAVSHESVNAVIRKHLPTKEAYMTHYSAQAKKLEECLTEFFDGIKKIAASVEGKTEAELKKDEEYQETEWKMEMYKKAMGSISLTMKTRLQKEALQLGVDRIYGA